MPRGRKPKIIEPKEFNHSDHAVVSQIDFKSEKWTVSKLINAIKKEKINDKISFQRGLCWNPRQRSLFIHSIILNYYIPPLIAAKQDNNTFNLLDGKQRATTLQSFCDNHFSLKDIPPIPYDDGTEEDFNGYKFRDLPEDIQEFITGYNLTLVIFNEETSKEQTEDAFFRANNGTALKSSDKNFSKAVSKDRITSLITHDIFDDAMTETAREKLAQRQLIINSYILLLTDDYSLDASSVSKFLREYEISDKDKGMLDMILERLHSIAMNIGENADPGSADKKIAKRILGRTNIPILVKFLKTHEDDETNTEFLKYFFSGDRKASINEDYNDASQAGSGHMENIQRKLNALNDEFEKFE